MRPNFFILGAAKCGTSSLCRYIGQHHDVAFSNPKEPVFFEAEYEKGLDYYIRTYFSDWHGEARVGEARHRNLFLPYVPQRIRASYPDARLIVILRNPTDRAFSDWLMRRRSLHEGLDFDAAIAADLSRIESGMDFSTAEGIRAWQEHSLLLRQAKARAPSPGERLRALRYRTYVDSGYYARQIQRYMGLFPRRQLKVVLLEDLAADPHRVVGELWRFLALDSEVRLADTAPSNVRRKPTTETTRYWARALLGDPLLAKVPGRLRQAGVSLLDRWAPAPRMSQETRGFLVSHFAPHNRALEALVDRDLSHWDR